VTTRNRISPRELIAAIARRRRLVQAIEVAVAVVVVGLCAYGVKGEWSKAGPLLEEASPGFVALAIVTVAAYYLVFILGWMRILATWGIRIPYRAALQAEMVSMLAKYVPGGVWTPAARVAALGRLTGVTAAGTVLGSILVEAVLSAISGAVVFVVSLIWVHDVDAPLVPIVLFVLACVLVLHPRVFRPVTRRLLRPFGITTLEPLPFSTMAELFGFYCLTWLLGGLGLYFLIHSLGHAPGLETIPFLGGVAAVGAIVAVLVVFAPSGLGVREASMYGLLIAVTSKSSALGTTILNRLVITIVELGLFLVGIALWRVSASRE
jgi:uncharacterized membrane protein YbhN (UPF0104 family)